MSHVPKKKVILRVGSFLQWHLTRFSDGSKSQLSQGTLTTWSLCNLLSVLAPLSFRGFMTALAPAFSSVDTIAGLNLNYRKCCWVHYGNEERGFLRTWILAKCEEFREMQIVRHAKYVGTMIGPDGQLPSSLDCTPEKILQRVMKINAFI